MNNKSQVILIVILIILISLVLITGGHMIYKTVQSSTNSCLIDKAKSYCQDKGYSYGAVWWAGATENFWSGRNDNHFSCRLNEREVESVEYRFLDSELEECLR